MSTATQKGRRAGYVLAVLINLALLFVVNIWPGWESVPFLTADAAALVVLVNVSLIVSAVTNLVYVAADPAWLKALGDLLTTAIALAVMIGALRIFPFDFGGSSIDWDLWARVILWFLTAVLVIAVIAQAIALVRAVVGADDSEA